MRAKLIITLIVCLITVFLFVRNIVFADEIEFPKIAGVLEQQILIKNDIIESVKTGVSELQKACDLENNQEANDTQNNNPLIQETKNDFIAAQKISLETRQFFISERKKSVESYRNYCSILGQIIGNKSSQKETCEKTKNKIEFIDRLIPSLDKNTELESIRSLTLNTLFQMEKLKCTSPNFSSKIHTEIKTVLQPLDASIGEEFIRASKLIE